MKVPLNQFFAFVVLVFCSTSVVFSQTKEENGELKGKGTVFFELFGNGGLYSVNYDRIFYHKGREALGWRVGLTYWPYSDNFIKTSEMSFLGEFNYLRGKKPPHFFEAGLGLTHWRVFGLDEFSDLYLFTRIGYRYQKPKGGIFFRIGATPFVILERNLDRNLYLLGGVSLGYTFKKSKSKPLSKKNSECFENLIRVKTRDRVCI